VHPFTVVQVFSSFAPRLTGEVTIVEVPVSVPTYTVQYPSSTLKGSLYETRWADARWDMQGEDLVAPIRARFHGSGTGSGPALRLEAGLMAPAVPQFP
jgi:hypothetical protein